MTITFSSSALVAVVVAFSVIVGAQSADTGSDCSAAVSGVQGCLPFLSNPSSTPDQKTCCQPLQTVLTTPSSFQCLCALATNAQSAAFKNALGLPQACKLDINVAASNCTATPTTPSTTPGITPTAANTTTTPAGSGSGGFLSASPYSPFVALALLCSIASIVL